jgi:23S rRNA (cytosine1962-C5)-methyltransferase
MSSPRTLAWRRYQLGKAAVAVVAQGHPWLFRGQLSSAARVFADGQRLRLVDGANATVGHGTHAAEGAIGIRIWERGPERPDAAWALARLDRALAGRRRLRRSTDAFRAVHGESDGLPGVVLEVYGPVVVAQSYCAGSDALARFLAAALRHRLALQTTVWKPARRRVGGDGGAPRVLAGAAPGPVAIHEGELTLWVDVLAGQKSGAYLDLRGLRRWVVRRELEGRRVLNLFAYTGTLGAAAERAGASEIWQVETSAAALDLARRHHLGDPARHRLVEADVFAWLPALPALPDAQGFDLVVVDPPQMTSRADQVDQALAAYDRLYRAAARQVAPGGTVAACCCTSRISFRALRATVERALGRGFAFVERLPAEPDHPVAFREADYLKILLYRRGVGEA